MARALALAGAELVIASRDEEHLQAAQQELLAAGSPRVETRVADLETPAGAVRLASERSASDFVEIRLDTNAARPHVVVHAERVKGRERYEETQPIREGVGIEHLTDEDVLDALAGVIGVFA